MDLDTNFGKSEDRISRLPDSILHHILSFLNGDVKDRTCVLSKRWRRIWTSIPTLKFAVRNNNSRSKTKKFIDFVDRTLHFHDDNIQDISLYTNKHIDAARVHFWISIISKPNVQKIFLCLDLHQPLIIPLSLFTCQSLIELHIGATNTTQLPKIFSLPKLKTLTLNGIEFTDHCSWNEQHLSNCPVLEELTLIACTWLGVRNFWISTPTLKELHIYNNSCDDGLRNCVLKIHAPNLVELTYLGCVAEYVFSIFQKLEYAVVELRYENGVPREQQIGYGAAISKFFLALSHVKNITLDSPTLETMSIVDDLANVLPTFHDLERLMLSEGETTDKVIFPLLKAAPNITFLLFENCIGKNKESKHDWAALVSTAGCLLQHLEEFYFVEFSGNARQMRWLKLILKKAKTLKSVSLFSDWGEDKEAIISKLQKLRKASGICKFKFENSLVLGNIMHH